MPREKRVGRAAERGISRWGRPGRDGGGNNNETLHSEAGHVTPGFGETVTEQVCELAVSYKAYEHGIGYFVTMLLVLSLSNKHINKKIKYCCGDTI
uniref:Uncharacterized protein n=1 Tax=Neogobius melanostomus TaxID=47308 RepID=A0A8C6WJ14_9GOBI